MGVGEFMYVEEGRRRFPKCVTLHEQQLEKMFGGFTSQRKHVLTFILPVQ